MNNTSNCAKCRGWERDECEGCAIFDDETDIEIPKVTDELREDD